MAIGSLFLKRILLGEVLDHGRPAHESGSPAWRSAIFQLTRARHYVSTSGGGARVGSLTDGGATRNTETPRRSLLLAPLVGAARAGSPRSCGASQSPDDITTRASGAGDETNLSAEGFMAARVGLTAGAAGRGAHTRRRAQAARSRGASSPRRPSTCPDSCSRGPRPGAPTRSTPSFRTSSTSSRSPSRRG